MSMWTHKPIKTVGSILKRPEDKFSEDLSTRVVYKIKCKDCEKVYIGLTSRALKTSTKEHKTVVITGDKNFLLAQHCAQNSHEFDLDDVQIVDRRLQWSRELFLEVWHSIRDRNSINEHIQIPDMYTISANP